jgi:hypothetical protein
VREKRVDETVTAKILHTVARSGFDKQRSLDLCESSPNATKHSLSLGGSRILLTRSSAEQLPKAKLKKLRVGPSERISSLKVDTTRLKSRNTNTVPITTSMREGMAVES